MADRTRKTRRKTTFPQGTMNAAPTRPRNPLVAPAMKRVAGPHRKSASAMRAAGRLALQRATGVEDRDDD